MDERNRTQDNLKFCFDLSTWKVVRPFSREEVGVGEEWGNTVRGGLGIVDLRFFALEVFSEP